MSTTQLSRSARSFPWRAVMWGSLAVILFAPLVAMRFTDQVRWGSEDFIFAVLVLGGFGLAVEGARATIHSAGLLLAAVGAALAVTLLIWAEAAVGVL